MSQQASGCRLQASGLGKGIGLRLKTTHNWDRRRLDANGTPLWGQARVVGRMRRPTLGTLDVGIPIDDPGTFTRPFAVGVRQRLAPDGDLIEFLCNENERSSQHFVRR